MLFHTARGNRGNREVKDSGQLQGGESRMSSRRVSVSKSLQRAKSSDAFINGVC